MADENIKFTLDLDADKAKASAESFKATLEKIGKTDSLDGVISGFLQVGVGISAAMAAMYLFKKAFDLTLEGEHIQKVNEQFNALAKDAGVNAESIKDGLEKATKGTVDMTDAMEAANKAIVSLGPSASKIPQLFDLARKATKVFGGDVTQNFEGISQAIANGNTRMLKHLGIIVDSEKAYRNFAAANNTTVASLSQVGRQQALLNAVLEQGNKKFKDNAEGQKSISQTLKEFLVTAKDVGDQVATIFNKAFGPAFQKMLSAMNDGLKNVTTSLKANFGDGAEKAGAQSEQLRTYLAYLNTELEKQKKLWGEAAPQTAAYQSTARQIDEITQKLQNQSALASAMAEEERKHAAEKMGDEIIAKGPGKGDESAAIIDKNKALKEQIAFEKEVNSIKQQNIELTKATTTQADEFLIAQVQERELLDKSFDDEVEALKQREQEKAITTAQFNEERTAIEEQRVLKIQALEVQADQERSRLYDNQLAQAKNLSQGFAAAANQQALALQNQGAQGTKMYNSVQAGSVKFFKSIGDGSKSAGDAMKEFLLGALADYVNMKGEALIAEGIALLATGQAAGGILVGEGGALIALGSLIGSMSGGGSSGGGGGGGGGGGAAGPSYAGGADVSAPTPNAQTKKSVNITVQGSYFETQETQRRLVDLLKQENDATDYKFTQIGVR